MSDWYACRSVWIREPSAGFGRGEAVFHHVIEAEDAEEALEEAFKLSKYPDWYLFNQSAIECVDRGEAEKMVAEWRGEEL